MAKLTAHLFSKYKSHCPNDGLTKLIWNIGFRKLFTGFSTIIKSHDNGSVQIKNIDEEVIPLLINGNKVKVYKKPLSKQEFINGISKRLMLVEKVSASTPSSHWKKKKQERKKEKKIKRLKQKTPWGTWVPLFGWKPLEAEKWCQKKKRKKR